MAFLYKTICILVSGKMHSGKTTLSYMLVDRLSYTFNLHSGGVFSFAYPVKKIARLMGWDGKKDERGRKLLQTLGTECGKAYDKDMWSRILFDNMIPGRESFPFDVIAIDDWRFPSELGYVRKKILYDPIKIRIWGNCSDVSGDVLLHSSENSLPTELEDPGYYDYIVANTGDYEDLRRQADSLAEDILKRFNKEKINND